LPCHNALPTLCRQGFLFYVAIAIIRHHPSIVYPLSSVIIRYHPSIRHPHNDSKFAKT
jgi:hypothetical protein